jgi:hypothetical protein
MESLLVNLRKYRPRDKSDPLENFVTEAFAWLLRSSNKVTNAVVELVNENLIVPVEIGEDITISTQENFAGKFPDMLFSTPEMTLVFEHKVWSPLHSKQLENYRNFIAKKTDLYRLVLITARTYQHKQNPDAALCWYQVYKKLDIVKLAIKDSQLNWAIDEFLLLLRSEGLGPASPINPFAIEHYQEAIELEGQLGNLIQQASHLNWPINSLFECGSLKSRYGRVGLEFCKVSPSGKRQWLPGIFCGFLLNGDDHLANDLLSDGLKISIIIDFNEKGQKFYPENETYKLFLLELNDLINKHEGWKLSDRTTENNVSLNKWHPLILVKSMADLFEGKNKLDEQITAFHQEISTVQNLLLEAPSFQQFIDELTASYANKDM